MNETFEMLISECHHKFPGLLVAYPPSRYIESLKGYAPSAMYCHVCISNQKFCQAVEEYYSIEAMALLHKIVMLHFIQNPLERVNTITLTSELQFLVANEHHRIMNEFATEPDEFYSIKNDKFLKDLALCTGRLFYAGAPVLEPFSTIPKRLVVSSGPMKTLQVIKAGGFAPYFQVHTSDKHLQEYNEQGWDRCYKRAAQLLELNSQFKGIFGSSWFYDPAIEKISPRISYLRSRQLKGGALSIFMSQDQDSADLATRTSPTRRSLYESGEYIPKKFLLIWPRNELLAWAKANK